MEQAWLDALVEAGHPERQAKDVVRLTFAIARGFGVRQLIAGEDEEFPHLMDAWMHMAGAMLLFSSAGEDRAGRNASKRSSGRGSKASPLRRPSKKSPT
ncbi:hypothetical protein D9M68_974040 [compost metagenome]